MSSALNNAHFDVVIIGAGMSGIAAGIRLARFGKQVLILERHTAVGGLNSYYARAGRSFDTGLHAITNYVPSGAKGAPLTKLLRQLRLRHEELALAPQLGSAIHFAEKRIAFSNNFALLESEIAREFPAHIDAFRRLDQFIRGFHETALDAPPGSARQTVSDFIADAQLVDTLFLPLSYYGSARPNDMDFPQFAIMWKSIFHEGFARPLDGVRHLLRLLLDKYREAGGTLKLNCGVRTLQTDGNRVAGIELDNGDQLSAGIVLSSAGLPETLRLCAPSRVDGGGTSLPVPPAVPAGQLAFCETITVLNKQPRTDFNWDKTIIFFNNAERLHYEPATTLTDPRSGVICIPNNYDYADGANLRDGWLRVTTQASYAAWKNLAPADYAKAKACEYERLNRIAHAHLPAVDDAAFASAIVARDMFTPPTIECFTGRINGAIYGSPQKCRDGRTHLRNLFVCGTDQGFLGIIGAMLSGISMANLHALSAEAGAH